MLNEVKYSPYGNNFGAKINTIKSGLASKTDLELIQYASLFNIVMFDNKKLKPEELAKLTQELTTLEETLGIKYVFQPFELNVDRCDYENKTPQFLNREDFLKTIFQFHRNSLRDSNSIQNFDSLSDLEKFKKACLFNARCSATISNQYYSRPVETDNFLIQANNENGNPMQIDLSNRRKNYREHYNTYFLMQIMSGEEFTHWQDLSSKTYKTLDLFKLAKSTEMLQYPDAQTHSDKVALQIIAKGQRRGKIQELKDKFITYLKNLTNPKEDRNAPRT